MTCRRHAGADPSPGRAGVHRRALPLRRGSPIAAAKEPELISGIVEINPFTRTQKLSLGGFFRIGRYRKGLTLLMRTQFLRSLKAWMRYLDLAYPTKPADYPEYMAALRAKLLEPGRMAEFLKTGKSTPADAAAQLPKVRCAALIIMGAEDPDFADPRAEGDAIVAALPAGRGTVAMVEAVGHYPHAGNADAVAALVIPFLAAQVHA